MKARRRGYALLVVLVFLSATLVFVAINQRRLSNLQRLERSQITNQDHDEGAATAMGRALSLLETGLPPSSPFSCYVTTSGNAGPGTYLVQFATAGSDQWTISVSPLTNVGTVPAMPTTWAQ